MRLTGGTLRTVAAVIAAVTLTACEPAFLAPGPLHDEFVDAEAIVASELADLWGVGGPARVGANGIISRDGEIVGWLKERPGEDSSAPDGLDGGQCLVHIRYYVDTGEIISWIVLFCWGGDGEGAGGGGNRNNGRAQAESAALTCDETVVRGSSGGCSPTVAQGASVSNIRWTAGDNSETGTMTWNGVAVDDIRIVVTGVLGGEEFTTEATVRVLPRTWSFPTLNASVSYGGAGWPSGRWGLHTAWVSTSPAPQQGTGPWAGMFMLDGPPALDNVIELHSDLIRSGPAYPRANRTCGASSGLAGNANVWTVNDTCGTLVNLITWETTVLQHERRHEESGSLCLQSATAGRLLDSVEGLAGEAVYGMREFRAAWQQFEQNSLSAAFEGRVPADVSLVLWDYRSGGLWRRARLASPAHQGMRGC